MMRGPRWESSHICKDVALLLDGDDEVWWIESRNLQLASREASCAMNRSSPPGSTALSREGPQGHVGLRDSVGVIVSVP